MQILEEAAVTLWALVYGVAVGTTIAVLVVCLWLLFGGLS